MSGDLRSGSVESAAVGNVPLLDEDTCDATHALLEAPDGGRIEEHARELLSRAVQSGRVVAFVGAGASMAYGRISWRDLVIAMQERALKKFDTLASPSDAVKRVRAVLEGQRISAQKKATPDDFITVFQLAEQLFRACARPEAPLHGGGTAGGRTDPEFRAEVSNLIRDDRGHALQLLSDGLGTDAQFQEPPQEPVPESDFRRAVFLADVLARIGQPTLSTAELALLSCLRTFNPSPSQSDVLKPYHRFLNGLALSMLPAKEKRTLSTKTYWGGDEKTSAQHGSGEPGRGNFLPAERDPLMITLKLGIARFLTTNFDHEIERMLDSEGYRHEPPGRGTLAQSARDDRLGRPWRDVVFDRLHVGHLLAFAARDGRQSAEVVHLHGRAEAGRAEGGRGERLTVTEGDYQERYLGRRRPPVGHG